MPHDVPETTIFGMPVVVDHALPPGTAELRSARDRVRLANIMTDQTKTTVRQEDPGDASLIIRHLIGALERATAGRWIAAQRNVEYAASRLYCAFGPRLPLSDEEANDA